MIKTLVTYATGKNLFSYIKRVSDNLFYDDSDGLFRVFGSLVDGKIDFLEDSNIDGEYSWERDIPDGEYIVYTKEDTGMSILNAAEAFPLTVKFGNEVSNVNVLSSGNDFISVEVIEDNPLSIEVNSEPCI